MEKVLRPTIEFVPTLPVMAKEAMLLAGVGVGDHVFDLGCGDGAVLRVAREMGADITGVELDGARLPNLNDVPRRHEDLYDTDLSRATVIYLYLSPEMNAALLPKLRQLRPGVRVVTRMFELPGLEPDAMVQSMVQRFNPLRLYVAPFKEKKTATVKLTVGMPTLDDAVGVIDTIQALRLYHAAEMPETEIIVADNGSSSKHLAPVATLIDRLREINQPAKLVHVKTRGAALAKNAVFEHASGEVVICIDSHVFLWPNALRKIVAWFSSRPDCRDLVTGPMVYDDLNSINTHFDDVWRGGMWGVWGNAWRCRCGDFDFSPTQKLPSTIKPGEKSLGDCTYLTLATPQKPTDACPSCGLKFPDMPWTGYEWRLTALGCTPLGKNENEPCFEVPASGMGCFGCRKDAWLGFNENMRAWGGEEWYIQEKFRRAGAKALSLPFLRWWHRYANPHGHSDVRSHYQKVRNYVIGHAELGLPQERVRQHFHDLPEDQWRILMSNPSNPPEQPVMAAVQQAAPIQFGQPITVSSFGSVQMSAPQPATTKAGGCPGGCGQKKAKGEGPPPGQPWSAADPENKLAGVKEASRQWQEWSKGLSGRSDLIVIDNCRTWKELDVAMLASDKLANRWIAVLGTHAYADKDDGNYGSGFLDCLRTFLHYHREWTPIHRSTEGSGFTILSKAETDKGQPPGLLVKALNFAKAKAVHVAAGSPLVDDATFEARLSACMLCEHRNFNQCSKCGCPCDAKSSYATEKCPDNPARWEKVA